MDGTLVDTEPYWIAAETVLVESFGGTWTYEDALTVVGLGLWDSAAKLQAAGVAMDADAIVLHLTEKVQEKLRTDGVPFRPGAQELLRQLRDQGVKTALVTMSIRSMAEQVVSNIPFEAFDLLVTGDEVSRPKPHPEPYLKAADELGVSITECVAIEDSVTGVTSAAASGAATIAVPHAVSIEESDAYESWSTLAGTSAGDLADVLAARTRINTTTDEPRERVL
jgi:HAD superfamily hydrolase (TIGR01509 family)